MSYSRKRTYGDQGGVAKKTATRIVGGRALTYRPTAPIAGSFRSLAAPSMGRVGGYSFRSVGGRELNFKDTSLSGLSFSTTPVLTLLNGMAQGTTASTRIGRRINIKSIEYRFDVENSSASLWVGHRFMIVLDQQANAATPAFTDIYDVALPTTLRNISNMPRFKVLMDSGEQITVGSIDTSVDNDKVAAAYNGYMRCNIPVQYNVGTAGTIGDIQTNALYFVMIGNATTAITDAQVFTGQVRIRYDDN